MYELQKMTCSFRISEWNSWFWISVRCSSKWSTGALSHNALSQVCVEWWQFTWGHIWDRRQFYPLWILLLPTSPPFPPFPYQSLRGKMFVDMECQNILHVNSIVYFAFLSKVFLQTYKRTAIKELINMKGCCSISNLLSYFWRCFDPKCSINHSEP